MRASDPAEARARLFYLAAAAAILVLATLLRFYRLDASSLWSDEGNTWAMLGRSYAEIAGAAAADIHPPGYYWLLKLWSGIFGTTAWTMRSFSALTGVLLVLLVERCAHLLVKKGSARFWLPLLAALVAAVNPLQVYYSQEARMYIFLAFASTGLFWSVLSSRIFQAAAAHSTTRNVVPALAFVVFAALGLWIHYSFVIVLAGANLAWLIRWTFLHVTRPALATWRTLGAWVLANLLALLFYLPWLPTAIDRVLHWPKGGVVVTLAAGLEATLHTLVFGPVHITPQPAWPWLLAAAALPLAGLPGLLVARGEAGPTARFALPLGLWLGLPVALMAGLGLFSDAFLKFLIIASPAWCLLAACVPLLASQRAVRMSLALAVAVIALIVAAATLPAYYQDANARDNYQGIAAHLAQVGDPQRDLVLLDAPGQQEVWRYYNPGLPVLALPATRPPVAAEVESTLAAATAGRRHVYALFWATDEADPDRSVESWLNRNAFKSLDVWQGNVRLAIYALAAALQPVPMQPVQLGESIVLAGQAQPAIPQHVLPGGSVLVQLQWDVLENVERRYKVSVQLLDAANHVVTQRDTEPVGDSRPTNTWRSGDRIEDNYALPVPLDLAPGQYRLLVAVYDAESGQRLQYAGGDAVELGSVWVDSPL